MRNFLISALTAAALLTLSACESQPVRRDGPSPSAGSPTPEVEQSGDAWLSQARAAAGSRATTFYLNAAQAYLNEGRLPAFGSVLAQLGADLPGLQQRAEHRNRYGQLRAAYHLSQQDAEAAARWLATSDQPRARTEAAEADRYWRLQTAICEAQSSWACVANGLIALREPESLDATPWQPATAGKLTTEAPTEPSPALDQRLPHSTPALAETPSPAATFASQSPRQRLNDAIWLNLNRATRAVARSQQQDSPTPAARAWWSLRLELAAVGSRAERRLILRNWQRRHGAHPAGYPWPMVLASLLNGSATAQREVAVLLPLSGSFAAAGAAIRDGFVAAQLETEQPVRARFYDVAAAPLPQLLEQLAPSTELIIGPLTKSRVTELANATPAQPALVLNYLDTHPPASPQPVFQLGIAIEDEAETLTNRLVDAGHDRLLVLYGKAAWAERAATRLAESWPGYLRAEPFESVKTITEAVGRGMFVDDSHLRSQRIRRTIDAHIEFVPRARRDLDAVVAFVSPLELQALRPALKFHFANKLPLFTTSQAARSEDPKRLAALRGAKLTELPALVNAPLELEAFSEALELPSSRLAGLYALGADALRLSEHLGSQPIDQGFALDGATGALSLQPDGRFRRELAWATFGQDGLRKLPAGEADAAREQLFSDDTAPAAPNRDAGAGQ